MRNMMTMVLGGGRGTRLYPLTKFRSKPAVPLAGLYRLIDIPISNCINSGFKRIYVLTQFMSVSLHRHIRQTYRFDRFDNGFVEILAAQQTEEKGTDWYQGTADAVRKNLRYLEQPGIDYVMILSGDQLYRMDYREMVKTHIDNKADATIAGMPVDAEQTRRRMCLLLAVHGGNAELQAALAEPVEKRRQIAHRPRRIAFAVMKMPLDPRERITDMREFGHVCPAPRNLGIGRP